MAPCTALQSEWPRTRIREVSNFEVQNSRLPMTLLSECEQVLPAFLGSNKGLGFRVSGLGLGAFFPFFSPNVMKKHHQHEK